MKWHRLPPHRCPSVEGRAGGTSSPPLGTRFGVAGTYRANIIQEKPVATGEQRGRTELDKDHLCLCATAPIACPQRCRDRKVPSPGPGEVTGITELDQRLPSALENPGKANQCPPSTNPALATTRAGPVAATATKLSQTLHPICWSGESPSTGTGSQQPPQLCDGPSLLFSCSQQQSPHGMAFPRFPLCSWPEMTPVPGSAGATT